LSLEKVREQVLRVVEKNLSETEEGVMLNIRIESDFDENYITIEGGELIFRTRESDENKYNATLIGFLSRELKIPSSKIDIVYGVRGGFKRLLIKDIDAEDLSRRLLKIIRLI